MKHTDKELKLFSRPLIIGASISAGFGTKNGGPCEVFARMMNPKAKITNLAGNGYTSFQSTSRMNLDKQNPSIIMGLDMFFWDAVRTEIGSRFMAHTRNVFMECHERGIPMIIGKVPIVDMPFKIFNYQKNAAKVNSLLEEICTLENNSVLVDPIECYINMDSEEHFSDGLHLTCEGNKFCAEFLAQQGSHKLLVA